MLLGLSFGRRIAPFRFSNPFLRYVNISFCALSLFHFPVSPRVFQFIGYYRTKPAEQRLIGMARRNNKATAERKKKDDEFFDYWNTVRMQLLGNYRTPNNEINKEEQGGQNRCLQAKKAREREAKLTGKGGFRVGTSSCQSNLKCQTNKDISNQQRETHQGRSIVNYTRKELID